MSTLASQSVSLHATPVGGSEMAGRPRGSYVSASSLTNEANFSGQSQEWHVIGSNGVTVSATARVGFTGVSFHCWRCFVRAASATGLLLLLWAWSPLMLSSPAVASSGSSG